MARKQLIPLEDVAKQCTRFLGGDGPRNVPSLLAQIPDGTLMDHYGSGGVVEELEHEVAAMFGKEAALFLPTGIMAQQTVLRVHADRRHLTTIALHPLSHLRT